MIESFVFIYGIIVGSFLNVLIHRVPNNISLTNPKRSYCPACNYQLQWYENIPLFSYLFLQAKCSNCKTTIKPHYFLVELLSGLITLALYFHYDFSFELILSLILFYTLITLSFIDFEYKAVPDYLLLITLICAFFIPDFNFLYALSFAGGFILLDFFVTFYIQNIKARITKDETLKTQKALGEGDIPIVAIIGGILGLKMGLIAIFLSALFALFPALYATIAKKEMETPFIPYLVLGFSVSFFFEIQLLQIISRLGL